MHWKYKSINKTNTNTNNIELVRKISLRENVSFPKNFTEDLTYLGCTENYCSDLW